MLIEKLDTAATTILIVEYVARRHEILQGDSRLLVEELQQANVLFNNGMWSRYTHTRCVCSACRDTKCVRACM